MSVANTALDAVDIQAETGLSIFLRALAFTKPLIKLHAPAMTGCSKACFSMFCIHTWVFSSPVAPAGSGPLCEGSSQPALFPQPVQKRRNPKKSAQDATVPQSQGQTPQVHHCNLPTVLSWLHPTAIANPKLLGKH